MQRMKTNQNCISFPLLHHKLPQSWQVKTTRTSYPSVSVGHKSWAATRHLPGLGSHQNLDRGSCFQTSSEYWQNSFPCSCTESCFFKNSKSRKLQKCKHYNFMKPPTHDQCTLLVRITGSARVDVELMNKNQEYQEVGIVVPL